MSSSPLAAAYDSLLEEVRVLGADWWRVDRAPVLRHTFKFAGEDIVFRKTGYSGKNYIPEHVGYSIDFGAIHPGLLTIWVHDPQETNTDANQRAALAAIEELARSPNKLTTKRHATDYLEP